MVVKMSFKIIDGDILESNAKYIVHQLNAVTTTAAGLANHLFKRFPWADVYSPRAKLKYVDELGSVIIKGNGNDQRYVIGIVGQYYPGKSSKNAIDSAKNRERYFELGLEKIAAIPDLESIAFPYMIGCGLAGGDWNVYQNLIENFAISRNDVKVAIVKLPGI